MATNTTLAETEGAHPKEGMTSSTRCWVIKARLTMPRCLSKSTAWLQRSIRSRTCEQPGKDSTGTSSRRDFGARCSAACWMNPARIRPKTAESANRTTAVGQVVQSAFGVNQNASGQLQGVRKLGGQELHAPAWSSVSKQPDQLSSRLCPPRACPLRLFPAVLENRGEPLEAEGGRPATSAPTSTPWGRSS